MGFLVFLLNYALISTAIFRTANPRFLPGGRRHKATPRVNPSFPAPKEEYWEFFSYFPLSRAARCHANNPHRPCLPAAAAPRPAPAVQSSAGRPSPPPGTASGRAAASPPPPASREPRQAPRPRERPPDRSGLPRRPPRFSRFSRFSPPPAPPSGRAGRAGRQRPSRRAREGLRADGPPSWGGPWGGAGPLSPFSWPLTAASSRLCPGAGLRDGLSPQKGWALAWWPSLPGGCAVQPWSPPQVKWHPRSSRGGSCGPKVLTDGPRALERSRGAIDHLPMPNSLAQSCFIYRPIFFLFFFKLSRCTQDSSVEINKLGWTLPCAALSRALAQGLARDHKSQQGTALIPSTVLSVMFGRIRRLHLTLFHPVDL